MLVDRFHETDQCREGKIAWHHNHDRAESRNFAHAIAPRRVGNAPLRRISDFKVAALARCPPYQIARYDSNLGNAELVTWHNESTRPVSVFEKTVRAGP
jgi:hypothetical protein